MQEDCRFWRSLVGDCLNDGILAIWVLFDVHTRVQASLRDGSGLGVHGVLTG